MPSDDFGRSASDYWKRLGAGNNPPQDKPRRAVMKEPAPPPIDETDPLALIYGALQANADATKENTVEAQALRQAVAASDALTGRSQTIIEDHVRSILIAVNSQSADAERIAKAEDAKYFWAALALLIGILVGLVVDREIVPLLQQWF
jgi:hypothetical protein